MEDIDVTQDRKVFICDAGNNRVMIFDGDKTFCLFGGNGEGSSLTQLNWPNSILLVENEKKLLISDFSNDRVL